MLLSFREVYIVSSTVEVVVVNIYIYMIYLFIYHQP